jgi:acyl-coenzyme A synthetase/AMP-(fatty) acid ligase
MVGQTSGPVEVKVQDGTLRLRSQRTATSYIGSSGGLADAEGFVDTGDLLELRHDRYYFVGRREGIINVGGLKVHPEEVEALINRHPRVHISLVRAKRSPITGAIVVADVVLRVDPGTDAGPAPTEQIEREIRSSCQAELASHKVPALIRFVPSLAVTAGGKLVRKNA